MKQDKKLTLEMFLLFIIIFITFGTIVLTEKLAPYNIPKVDKKLNNYLKENYKEILDEVKINDTTYKNTVYKLKITHKENKNLYFYINYENKNISDTYKTDYLKGKTLLTKISKDIEKEIKSKTKKEVKVTITKNLNDFSNQVKKRLLEEKNLLSLKIYTLNLEYEINEFNTENITNIIKNKTSSFEKQNITPKNFNITITDKNDITKSVEIDNITTELVNSTSFNQIISDIINKEKSNILKENNITYQYLN